MHAALKTMFAFLQTRDIDSTGLKNASPGHRNVRKAAGTFGDRGLSVIQRPYEAATELRHLGEGMRLAALVDYADCSCFLDVERVRFEVPARVRSSIACLLK
jgi:hypothetical protein